MLWKRPKSKPNEEPPERPGGGLEPVRIFTTDTIIDGWVDTGGQRLSDILSAEDLLSVSPPRDPTEADWFVVERERMLLVVPPCTPAIAPSGRTASSDRSLS